MLKRNRKKNIFKRFGILSVAALLSVSFLASCNLSQGKYTPLYDPKTGIDYDAPITKLIVNKQSSYKIVIPIDASASEKYASEELQSFVNQATGVQLEIVSDDNVSLGDRCISLGDTTLFEESGLNVENLNVDGFRIKTSGETVLIKGQRDSGTLLGVYDFLEKLLDIKFLTTDYTYIPTLKEIQLYQMDVTEIPSFTTRNYHGALAKTKQAEVVRMRLSPNTEAGSWEGKAKFGGMGQETACNLHSYDVLVPYAVYSVDHPEWFSQDPDTNGRAQPSLANGLTDDGEVDETMEESVVKTVIESVKRQLIERPEAIYVPLSQNDSNNFAIYEDDVRQRELFGGYAAHSIVFVNAIAEKVDEWLEVEYPGRKVSYLLFAYGPTLAAPKQTAEKAHLAVPNDNVYIMYAPLQASWNIPLMDSRNSRTSNTEDGIPVWREITDNFHMYDYTTNFNNMFSWYPILPTLKTNVELYADMGVKYYISEGLMQGYQNELKVYVLSKLMWNKDRDVNELISEFNRYSFGEEAGKLMDQFVYFSDAHFERVASSGTTYKLASIYDKGSKWLIDADTLSVDYIRRIESFTNQAKELIESDTTISQKTKTARLNNLSEAEVMVDMMKYLNYDSLWKTTAEAKDSFLRTFYNRVKKTGVTQFGSETWGTVAEEFAKYGIY